MKPPRLHILAVNGGSSSIKFALFEIGHELTEAVRGSIERIGLPGTTLKVTKTGARDETVQAIAAEDHAAAAARLVECLEADRNYVLAAVGHRIVHGGPSYSQPEAITPAMLAELERLTPYDPAHLPGEIHLAKAFRRSHPGMPQVACFDTAFHHRLPRLAQLLPIPRRYAADGVRRYGFHGLSYEFLLDELNRVAGPEAARGRVVLAHLGNGASLSAVREGRPIDTSMGFTPLGGVPMSTRSGDLDPGVLWYLARERGLDAAQLSRMTNFESGLLGVSETSSDMGDLLAREPDDERAADAVGLFCYQVKKWIGSFAAVLGGIDTLVFAGGIGEHAPTVRSRICAGLGFLGVELDEPRNAAGAAIISTATSPVAVRVIHTNEELVIARAVNRVAGPFLALKEAKP